MAASVGARAWIEHQVTSLAICIRGIGQFFFLPLEPQTSRAAVGRTFADCVPQRTRGLTAASRSGREHFIVFAVRELFWDYLVRYRWNWVEPPSSWRAASYPCS